MTDKTMLNFRCPNDLLEAIDQIGRQRYPADNKSGCDRSKTLMDIVQAGIQALSDGTVEIPVSKTSKTDSKTVDSTEVEAIVEAVKKELDTMLDEKLAQRLGKEKAR